jgi:hypothetical protein
MIKLIVANSSDNINTGNIIFLEIEYLFQAIYIFKTGRHYIFIDYSICGEVRC